MKEVHYEDIYFTGHVQGVGFRYTVLQAAKEFEVSGTVRNLPDGRVRLEAEGEKAEVDRFLKEIGERMHGHIRNIERHASERLPEFSGFAIR